MAGGSRFVAIEQSGEGQAPDAAPAPDMAASADSWVDAEWEEAGDPATGSVADWLMPALAFLCLMVWSNLFIWANHEAMMAGASPAQWIGWVGAWSGPVLLIGVVWLLVMRSSRRHAARFVDAARQVESEAARLETRLVAVNRELSLAREFLAAEARDLESLGRIAAERLGEHARALADLIISNGAQVQAIGSVSSTARDNMEALRGQLPVIAASAKDVANNIGHAGRIAHGQLDEMVSGLARINEFGQAAEHQVISLRGGIYEALGVFDATLTRIDAMTDTRLATLAERGAALQDALTQGENAALTALHRRLDAVRDAADGLATKLRDGEARALDDWQASAARLDGELGAMSARLERADHTASEAAQARIEALGAHAARIDGEFARHHAAQDAALAALAERSSTALAEMAAIEARARAINAETAAAQASLAERLDRLTLALADGKERIAATDTALTGLTDSSVRLLELIQASVQHSRDNLPKAIGISEHRLGTLETRAIALRDTVGEAGARAEDLSRHVLASGEALAGIAGQTATQSEALSGIAGSLAAITDQTEALAARAQGELSAAIAQLAGTARGAVDDIETHGSASISALAERLGAESGAAIEKAMRHHAGEIAGQLEQAAAHAAGVSREAALQLRNQLAKVDELAGNLERRVAHARERAEEQVDNDFARRVALITEALNSNAIDIAKTLDSDVSDTAWAAYLRGDRGIFTRRAVRLLEAPEAKAVAQLYEDDRVFHDHVSHYIHDFEAMLRQLLSTRDGHSLGVTLLSSDMGKLYVALAQAIDRLRG